MSATFAPPRDGTQMVSSEGSMMTSTNEMTPRASSSSFKRFSHIAFRPVIMNVIQLAKPMMNSHVRVMMTKPAEAINDALMQLTARRGRCDTKAATVLWHGTEPASVSAANGTVQCVRDLRTTFRWHTRRSSQAACWECDVQLMGGGILLTSE